MNEITQTKYNELLLPSEAKMLVIIESYLCHILDAPNLEFNGKQFLALRDFLFTESKVSAIKYLRSLYCEPDKTWISTNNNNKFEDYINSNLRHIKPPQIKHPLLGLKEAKDIVDWIEANRQYTKY